MDFTPSLSQDPGIEAQHSGKMMMMGISEHEHAHGHEVFSDMYDKLRTLVDNLEGDERDTVSFSQLQSSLDQFKIQLDAMRSTHGWLRKRSA